MSKELNEKEKLGVEIMKDLEKVVLKLEEMQKIGNIYAINKLGEVAIKVKNLTLKF